MSGYGGNLTYPKTMLLFNSLDAAKIGLVDDDGTNDVLFVREHGLYLKGGSVVNVTNAVAAVAKKMKVTLSAACPCSNCHYEYGFTVKKISKMPGVFNDNYYGKLSGYYGVTDSFTCTSDLLSDAEMIAEVTKLLALIHADTGLGNRNDFQKGSLVDAILSYSCTAGATANQITITLDGVDYDVSHATDIVTEINGTATLSDKVIAVGTHAAFTVEGILGDTVFTVHTPTGNAAILSPVWGDIVLETKSEYKEDYTFQVQDAGNSSISTIEQGNYAYLTPDDVFRLFSHMAHDVPLSRHHRVATPPLDISYTKYTVEAQLVTGNMHGASHGNDYKTIVEFFVPTSAITTDIWDATDFNDETGGTPDQTFAELLAAWIA